MRAHFAIAFITLFASSASTGAHAQSGHAGEQTFTQRVYSKSVGDSFSVFIHLPDGYNTDSSLRYPVVFLLDANFYFDIAAATNDKYAMFALTDAVILVGIGYRDALQMDSLRNRDYTWPVALPEDEMGLSGGANRFLAFINDELIPAIDRHHRTDTSQRILFGHSLGGFFTVYALVKNTQRGSHSFSHYIAASPSLDYHKYYLLKELERLPANKKTSAYFTFGSLEDAEDADKPGQLKVVQLTSRLPVILKPSGLRCKAEVFSNLAHMDTPMPTFIKGLQWSLAGYESNSSMPAK